MVVRTEEEESYRDWIANDWNEIQAVWRELPADDEQRPRFRDRDLYSQAARWVFERWVIEAFRLSGFGGHYPYRVDMVAGGQTREQIDGLIFDGWQGFRFESKYWMQAVDIDPIFR
jgi:hypothetical protein